MQVGLIAGVTACFLAVGAQAEHCFDAEKQWFTTGGTGEAGYWAFEPSIGEMGPVERLPITCFQQDVRFEMTADAQKFTPLNDATASAQKCGLNVDPTSMTWTGGYDKSVSDWRIVVRAKTVEGARDDDVPTEVSRAFLAKCSLDDDATPVLRLVTSIVEGKAGEVKYVWRSNN